MSPPFFTPLPKGPGPMRGLATCWSHALGTLLIDPETISTPGRLGWGPGAMHSRWGELGPAVALGMPRAAAPSHARLPAPTGGKGRRQPRLSFHVATCTPRTLKLMK